MFCSFRQVRGLIATPHDDLESLVYVICYLLNFQNLPWISIFKEEEAKKADLAPIDLLNIRDKNSDIFTK